MIGKLNNEQIEELLKSQLVGRLACQEGANVYIVPMSYAYDGKYIYLRSFEGKKIEMMRRNHNVCFQVDDLSNMAEWKSVIALGEFEELTDEIERKKAIKYLIDRQLPLVSSETTHLGSVWPFSPENLNTIGGIVFRVLLKEKTGRFEKSKSASPAI